MQLGKFRIDAVETGVLYLDGGAMFGVVPKALWSKLYNPGDELNRIPLSVRPLLIQYDDRTILIDTGNGTKMSEKLIKIYGVDIEKSSIAIALQKFNLAPDDITDVILTHLHFDHAGGATNIENGKIVPAFKNARYYIQKNHYKWAINPSEKDRASFFRENYEPLMNDGLLELLDGDGDIFGGISVITVHGHTPSMQMVKITDDNKTLLYCADLCPTSAHIPSQIGMAYDNYPMLVINEKKQIIPIAYEEKWIVAFEHDLYRQASYILSNEKGFAVGERVVIT